jgi:hypothetical protein
MGKYVAARRPVSEFEPLPAAHQVHDVVADDVAPTQSVDANLVAAACAFAVTAVDDARRVGCAGL